MKKGILITIEGIDGSGKSSLATNLAKLLTDQNLDVLLTKEPGASNLGKQLRKILSEQDEKICDRAEFLLFAADRAEHIEKIIKPALSAGSIIISDRMADSSLAYQGFGRGLDTKLIASINKWAMDDLVPDVTIYIEIDVDTAMNRIHQRNIAKTSFEKENKNFWEKVILGYDEIFKSRSNLIKLNGKQSPNEIANQTYFELQKFIKNN